MPSPDDHRWIIDAIEDGVARVELDGGESFMMPAWLLPRTACAGCVLHARYDAADERSTLRLWVDADETAAALARSAVQLAAQPVDRAGGDITL